MQHTTCSTAPSLLLAPSCDLSLGFGGLPKLFFLDPSQIHVGREGKELVLAVDEELLEVRKRLKVQETGIPKLTTALDAARAENASVDMLLKQASPLSSQLSPATSPATSPLPPLLPPLLPSLLPSLFLTSLPHAGCSVPSSRCLMSHGSAGAVEHCCIRGCVR